MAQVAIVTADARLKEMLQSPSLRPIWHSVPSLASIVPGEAPNVMVLDIRGERQFPQAIAAYRRTHPQSAVVLVVSALDPTLMLEAMRAGVTECVAEPLSVAALKEAVGRVGLDSQSSTSGQLFAFIGAKGGVGATTLAVNTAATLAATLKRKSDTGVLLADLHLGHGDADLYLGVEPQFSIVDALTHAQRLDDALLDSVVARTKAGVTLLASSDRVSVTAVDSESTRALVEFCLRRYRYVVADVPRSDSSMLDALDEASTMVVVVSQDVSALRSAARMVRTLSDRYGSARVQLLVNRFDSRSDLGRDEIERAVGLPVAHEMPSDPRGALEALNLGSPLVTGDDQGLARAIRALADGLTGSVSAKREAPQGMFGRLAWRRA
ncbi:MAG: AAA family ATPase [Vicinamibacterales bacterium]